MNACSLLTKDQVGGEFGLPYGDGTASSDLTYPGALATSGCILHAQTADGNPVSFKIKVDTFPTEAAAKGVMVDYRTTTNSAGNVMWVVAEQPGLGDDAVFHTGVSLASTTEDLAVHKGSVIYHLIDSEVTGIPDSAASKSHLVSLARSVVNR